jgi:hypothetical protein
MGPVAGVQETAARAPWLRRHDDSLGRSAA